MSNEDHLDKTWLGRWIIGGGGLVTMVLAFAVNVGKDAQIALDVAQQHGEEILIMNRKLSNLEEELSDRTRDRYTSKDAERDIGYLRRDLDACMAWRAAHQREHNEAR